MKALTKKRKCTWDWVCTYLINRICVSLVVIFGNLQAVQNTSVSVEGSDFNRVTSCKERRPPIVDQPFINYHETLHIVESLPCCFPMQRYQILLVLTKPCKIRIQYSYPPNLHLNIYHISNSNIILLEKIIYLLNV